MQISVWLLRKLRQENPREGSALDESCSNPINEKCSKLYKHPTQYESSSFDLTMVYDHKGRAPICLELLGLITLSSRSSEVCARPNYLIYTQYMS